jgi:non-canonical purine NTP pyrophosphatase (RdgB/HAM1 family)
MTMLFATSNPNKAAEVAGILGADVTARSLDVPEIQSFSLEEIVRAKVAAAYALVGEPILVEDCAFDASVLGGFPGPFVKFWEKTAGYDVLVELAQARGDLRATARCGVGYADGTRVEYVEGMVAGALSPRRGAEGFGFDFYLIPDGHDRTMAEMGMASKNEISHRRMGFVGMRDRLRELGLM